MMMKRRVKERLVCLALMVVYPVFAVAADTTPAPCTDPEYRQFDFWLGHWTAFDAQGKKQGSNHIHPIMSGCGVQENWSSGGGFKGTSYNFYNAQTNRWYQTWVDNQGNSLRLTGRFSGAAMVLGGERQTPDGVVTDRITFTPLPDGRVRQHWQTSADGETWTDLFDGYYVRDKPS